MSRILSAFRSTPWAILPEKLALIAELLESHERGVRYTADEIRERIGAAASRPQARREGAVAVLPIRGTISRRAGLLTDASGGTSVDSITSSLRAAVADPQVKAIVLDVDSPGGSVQGVPELASEILAARDSKWITAIANDMAASAAYWIASACSEVVVTPSGEVGSIGVFCAHADYSAAYEAAGVKNTLIRAGKYKAEANPWEPLTDDARAAIQSTVDDYYSMFVAAVAKGRGTTPAAVRGGYGEGRILTAKAAVSEGLADRIATLDDVLQRLGAAPSSSPRGSAAAPLRRLAESRLSASPYGGAATQDHQTARARGERSH